MQGKRQNSIARNCDHEMEEEMRENGCREDYPFIIEDLDKDTHRLISTWIYLAAPSMFAGTMCSYSKLYS